MEHHLARWMRPARLAVAALLLAGCSGSGKGPNQPPPPDLSTPGAAMQALRDAWGYRRLEDALDLLMPEYRFFPTRPESIPFLAAGELFWDRTQEQTILELLLVEERITWIDQVLLEMERRDLRDLGNGQVEYEARVQLKLFFGLSSLESSESIVTYLLQADAEGDYRIVEERESMSSQPGQLPIGELRARVLEDRAPGG